MTDETRAALVRELDKARDDLIAAMVREIDIMCSDEEGRSSAFYCNEDQSFDKARAALREYDAGKEKGNG